MARRALLMLALLCPACATGSGPLDPGDPAPAKTDTPAPDPPADEAEKQPPAKDPPASPAPSSTSPSSPPPSSTPSSTPPSSTPPASTPPASTPGHGGADVDCEALLALVDDLGCAIARFVCAVAANIPVHGADVPCDIAVPVACGLSSAVADAAVALCRH